MSSYLIADHALLSVRYCAALVTRDGSIVWMCSVLRQRFRVGSILHGTAGHRALRPTGLSASTCTHVEGTVVLHTSFHKDESTVELLDALELGASADPHRLGVNVSHSLLRCARCTSGRGAVQVVC